MTDQDCSEMLRTVRNYPKKAGKSDLIKHLSGKKITRGSAIKAKCYDCNGMGESNECDMKTCSLYPFSPYR